MREIGSDEGLSRPPQLLPPEVQTDEVLPSIVHGRDGCCSYHPPHTRVGHPRGGTEEPDVRARDGSSPRDLSPNCPHDSCCDRAFPEVMEAPFERGLMVREVLWVPWGAGEAARAGVCGAEVMAPCIPHTVDREALNVAATIEPIPTLK